MFTIRKVFKVNSVPTAVTSFAFAVTRADTGAAISGTTTNPATGVYEFTFTQPAPSLVYDVVYTIVYNGDTITLPDTVVDVGNYTPAPLEWPFGFRTILSQMLALVAQITLSPNPTYSVHGHSYQKGEYLEILGRQIEQFTKLNAQAHPFEIVSGGY